MRIKRIDLLLALVCVFALSGTAAAQVYMNHPNIYKKTAPAVTYIAAFMHEGGVKSGTGSIISKDGLILTCDHVIWDDLKNAPAMRLLVFLKPAKVTGKNEDDLARQYEARLLSRSAELDLALLQIENPPADLPVLKLADSSKVPIGEPTIAIGHPEQGVRWTLTTGAISGTLEDFGGAAGRDVWQMETSLNRGNSGGPLIGHDGQQIGINQMIARKAKDGLALTGIQFALTSNTALLWLKTIKAGQFEVSLKPETLAKGDALPVAKKVKVKSKLLPGKEYTESDLDKMKHDLEKMGSELENDFKRIRKQKGF